MNPNDQNEQPADLLRELETLQRVLDDAAGDHVTGDGRIPVLEPMDDIPVLNDLFNAGDTPVLKPVQRNRPKDAVVVALPGMENALSDSAEPEPPLITETAAVADELPAAAEAAAPQAEANELPVIGDTEPAPAVIAEPPPAPPAAPRRTSGNPFLPQSVLDRLTQEREAAQHSAEEAHRTMQKVMEQKQERARKTLNDIGRQLSMAEKEALISQLVDEMLPQLAERLREKLRKNLN